MNRRDGRRSGVDVCALVKARLTPYVLRTLDEVEREAVATHLDSCADCRETSGFVQARLQAIGAVDQAQVTQRRRRMPAVRRWVVLSTAVPVLIAFALLFVEGIRIARYRYERRFIARLEKAIVLYRLDHGSFPPADVPLAHSVGEYMQLDRERLDAQGHFLDHWGQRYGYAVPGAHNPRLFDLHSPGRNGRDEGGRGDDLCNWDGDWRRLPIQGER